MFRKKSENVNFTEKNKNISKSHNKSPQPTAVASHLSAAKGDDEQKSPQPTAVASHLSAAKGGDNGFLAFLCVSFSTSFIVIILSILFSNSNNYILTIIITFVTLALLLLKVYVIIKNQNKLITEFILENSVLSGALEPDSNICMIICKNGKITYLNRKYKKIIVNKLGSSRDYFEVKDLALAGLISDEDHKKMLESMSDSQDITIDINVTEPNDFSFNNSFSLQEIGIEENLTQTQTLRLSTDKKTYPTGFFIVEAEIAKTKSSKKHKTLQLVNNFKVGCYKLDKDNIITEVNDIFLDIFDKEYDEIIGLEFEDIIENVNQDVKLDYESDFEDIVLHELKDKTKQIIFLCHRKKAKKSKGFVLQVKDFKHFKEIAGEENYSYDFVENYPLSTAIIDENFKIVNYNSAFCNLFDFSNKKKSDITLDQLLKCSNGNEFKTVFIDFIQNKIYKKSSIEVDIKASENKSASLYVRKIDLLHDRSGKFIVSLIDTTDLRSLQMGFTHSQKMQAVGQLAGGVAHDFNNLLTAMLGFCDLLLDQHKPSDPSFANIMQIKQNANRAANLVKQLLAFSRKQTLQPQVIDVTDVIADLSNLIGRLIGGKVDLQIQHGRDLGNVRVDKTQLEQVIINLAVNARDAMNNSGALTIRTSNREVFGKNSLPEDIIPPSVNDEIIAGEYVLIEVTDTGCGIEKDKILKIFDPFFSTKQVGSGTGLGLSTVYGIIKQTDGYIYVSSKINEGTTFSVFLKRCFDEIEIESESSKELSSSSSDLAGSDTILLVEDEEAIRMFTSSALTSKGYKVLSPQTVDEALQTIQEKGDEIDLVISDVIMPGMNGPDMIKIARETHPDLKVIFISGYGEDAFIETYGNDRHFNFLSKPYSLKSLALKVKEVLQN